MSGAILSPCERYRYRLWRTLPEGIAGRGLFIMLNPSIADADIDDPTIRRCTGFAKRFGWVRYDVVNLFSFRATDSSELTGENPPVLTGPEHYVHLKSAIKEADIVVCAWSAEKIAVEAGKDALWWVRHLGKTPLCLGTADGGAPRHPLYLRKDAALRGYPE